MRIRSRVVETRRSPQARLKPVPVQCVSLCDTFWQPRRRVNARITLPSQYRLCEETGRIDNFRRAAGKKQGSFQGRYYNDSDVYKWVEAASFALLEEEAESELREMLAMVVGEIVDAQQTDGYLNTYFTHERQDQRWSNLKDLHELYCAGHLIQAAVAHRRCTGRHDLLRVATRYADLICDVFGPEGRPGTCGHQEIEMALVELFRETREKRYLDQARRFIEMRGQHPPVIGGSPYHQDHAPFRTLDAVVGHAVRMMYYCAGAADIYAETGDPEYLAALERLWTNMTRRRMYVTGGLGSRYEGEAFGADYELPNERAYAESCAAIASVMWNWRMLQLRGEARYADLIEHTLYNAVLPGLSLDGERYLYQNPLADVGEHRRRPWFDCACCPPNIARILTQLPGYFCSTSEEGIWVHLYASGSYFQQGHDMSWQITQETAYPWNGDITIRISASGEPASEWTLFLRIPGWAAGAELEVNGEPVPEMIIPGSYSAVRRVWGRDDHVRLTLPMPVRRVFSHPRVTNNVGRVALARGPLIYCAEQADLGVDPRSVILPLGIELAAEWEPAWLGGVMVLRGEAFARDLEPLWLNELYHEQPPAAEPAKPIAFTAVPYFAWGNRESGGMAVWLAAEANGP